MSPLRLGKRGPGTTPVQHLSERQRRIVWRIAALLLDYPTQQTLSLLEDMAAGPLVEAVRDGAAAVVNPYRARVANNKKLFALLQDPRFAHLVGKGEADVVRTTIPWTRVLREERTTYGDWVIDRDEYRAYFRDRVREMLRRLADREEALPEREAG